MAAHDGLDASVCDAERQAETWGLFPVSEPAARPYAPLLFTSIPLALSKSSRARPSQPHGTQQMMAADDRCRDAAMPPQAAPSTVKTLELNWRRNPCVNQKKRKEKGQGV